MTVHAVMMAVSIFSSDPMSECPVDKPSEFIVFSGDLTPLFLRFLALMIMELLVFVLLLLLEMMKGQSAIKCSTALHR